MSDLIVIKGNWFDSQTSASKAARLTVRHRGQLDARIIFSAGEELPTKIISISDRLGSIDRRIILSDNHVFVTPDNAGVDRISGLKTGLFSRVSKLETFHPRLLALVILVFALIFASIRWGLPVAAKVAVWVTPMEVVRLIDSGSLSTLDQLYFERSTLSPTEQEKIKKQLSALVQNTDEASQSQFFDLQFRGGDKVGANAMALPAGTIIVTDPLVSLMSEDELTAVLAHEVAHVQHDHGLQQFYRALGFAGLISVVTGDLGTVAEELLSGGGVLIALAASREMELHADAEAIPLLKAAGVDPINLVTALDKLSKMVCKNRSKLDCEETSWLSTHPGGEERRLALMQQIEGKSAGSR